MTYAYHIYHGRDSKYVEHLAVGKILKISLGSLDPWG
jgi:hypothetical protein